MFITDLLTAAPTEVTVTELLREVIDPELGINIVDLGLLREIAISPAGEVAIVMTTATSPIPPRSCSAGAAERPGPPIPAPHSGQGGNS